jgi:hypothetical protein
VKVVPLSTRTPRLASWGPERSEAWLSPTTFNVDPVADVEGTMWPCDGVVKVDQAHELDADFLVVVLRWLYVRIPERVGLDVALKSRVLAS